MSTPLEYQQDKNILLVAELNNNLTKLERLPMTNEKIDILRHLNTQIDSLIDDLRKFNDTLDDEELTGSTTEVSSFLKEKESDFSLIKLFSPFIFLYNEFLTKTNESYYNSI